MKLKIKSSLNPAIVRGRKYDRIVAGSIWEVNGEKWDHQYVAVTPGITFEQIEWVRNIPQSGYTENTVLSTKGNEKYIVRTYKDGRKTCTCYGFMYRKQCKHTKV